MDELKSIKDWRDRHGFTNAEAAKIVGVSIHTWKSWCYRGHPASESALKAIQYYDERKSRRVPTSRVDSSRQ